MRCPRPDCRGDDGQRGLRGWCYFVPGAVDEDVARVAHWTPPTSFGGKCPGRCRRGPWCGCCQPPGASFDGEECARCRPWRCIPRLSVLRFGSLTATSRLHGVADVHHRRRLLARLGHVDIDHRRGLLGGVHMHHGRRQGFGAGDVDDGVAEVDSGRCLPPSAWISARSG